MVGGVPVGDEKVQNLPKVTNFHIDNICCPILPCCRGNKGGTQYHFLHILKMKNALPHYYLFFEDMFFMVAFHEVEQENSSLNIK